MDSLPWLSMKISIYTSIINIYYFYLINELYYNELNFVKHLRNVLHYLISFCINYSSNDVVFDVFFKSYIIFWRFLLVRILIIICLTLNKTSSLISASSESRTRFCKWNLIFKDTYLYWNQNVSLLKCHVSSWQIELLKRSTN